MESTTILDKMQDANSGIIQDPVGSSTKSYKIVINFSQDTIGP